MLASLLPGRRATRRPPGWSGTHSLPHGGRVPGGAPRWLARPAGGLLGRAQQLEGGDLPAFVLPGQGVSLAGALDETAPLRAALLVVAPQLVRLQPQAAARVDAGVQEREPEAGGLAQP